jgi:hypothetical protein
MKWYTEGLEQAKLLEVAIVAPQFRLRSTVAVMKA